MPLEGFEARPFSVDGNEKTVFWRGEGPGVVIMHELPGITPPVREFAIRVADAGYTVAMPHLFGVPGGPVSVAHFTRSLIQVCISREFRLLATGVSSPVTDWIRVLCRHVHEKCGGNGVGAVGMCLTGGFALALMVDPSVKAPVLSQPSLPGGLGAARRCSLGISPDQLSTAKSRCENENLTIVGLRFTNDPLCPGERFATLRKELGSHFEGIEIDSSPGNPDGIARKAHSVLTVDLVDREGHPTRAALDRVMALFDQQLRGGTPTPTTA